MPPLIDLTGLRFGRLVVLTRSGNADGKASWRCRCDCGNEVVTRGTVLRRGEAKSCGCLQREKATLNLQSASLAHVTHGMSATPEYEAWASAKQRVTNPNNPVWPLYGGRGIRMADEWLDDFPAFLAHIGPRPSPALSLDRIDNDGDYAPGNVRWATRYEQAQNRRAAR